jgi:ATP-dependent Clp protease ATP-binding subunit ClpC
MSNGLTKQARNALALANEAARSLNHDFVGTEHVLLGLIEEGSHSVVDILTMFGVTADKVRAEIDRLIQRGTEPVLQRTLPLTPRSKQAIAQATIEANHFDETCAGPEHLLLGLMHDESGVAHQVLLNLGVKPKELRAEVFRIRIALMKIVEQAVRPLRAGTPRKRKIREELLAHLSAIYDEEQVRAENPAAALQAAARRFGEPSELTHELQSALSIHERISYLIERWFAWRAPESLARYAFRQAKLTFYLLAVVLPIVVAGVYLGYGWTEPVRTLTRIFASILILVPPAHFALTLWCFKMRDAMWGVFGSRKSLVKALTYDGLIALVVAAACLGCAWVAQPSTANVSEAFLPSLIVGAVAALAYLLAVIFFGPATIRDTIWALLEIENKSPENEAA